MKFLGSMKFLLLLLLMLAQTVRMAAQNVTGKVTDADTGETLPFVNVYYEGRPGSGHPTDVSGKYSIPAEHGRLVFSMMGYKTQTFDITGARTLNVKLKEDARAIKEVEVSKKKIRYSRKNNPAVEMMKKVIAAKERTDLHNKDFFTYDKYQKLTFSLNEVTEKVFQEDKFKRMPFLKDHVEVHPETGKLILPLTVDETVTRKIYRKDPKSEKDIVTGERSDGLNDLFNTGDIITNIIKDCFTDVDIYDDEVRLLQYPFISPISSASGIRFYRYFIVDTLEVDKEKCYQIDFTPNNPQDFGFSGSLFILADSTWRVKRAEMGIPSKSDVNFVEQMDIIQEFADLPTGEHVLVDDKMLVQLKLAKFLQKFQLERTTKYSDYSFEEIPEKVFKFKGQLRTEANAMMRDDDFWAQHRAEELTKSESKMDEFIHRLENIKGFNFVLFVMKAFIENFVETTADPKKPSKVDIGPVNTMITHNFVDGLRLRASAQTTANLNPHWFGKGYVAYGFKDHRWKGMGELIYSFNKKDYLPREFPVNNLSFSYANDVMSPSDRFVPTDKDNVFVSFKWTTVDHMMYYERYQLSYDKEWENGLRINMQMKREKDEPTAALFYQPLAAGPPLADPLGHIRNIVTSEVTLGVKFQPGATWINTKQRRLSTNLDSPIYSISHTAGFKGLLGGDYNYNLTEASVYKRFWLRSWGKMDCMLKGGVQWNKVPFPLLITPPANLSYIMEDYTFNLIDNMEFLNDRYASLMFSWDLNGKILNRIPLIKHLKWREYIGCNVLWGTLSSKNNPFLEKNAGDTELFYFPGNFSADGTFVYNSRVMDDGKPYVELIAGIHNIFKLLHVEYVHRMNYIRPGTQKWGIRFMFRMTF